MIIARLKGSEGNDFSDVSMSAEEKGRMILEWGRNEDMGREREREAIQQVLRSSERRHTKMEPLR